MTTVATIARIDRYPVKSMRGESLESASVGFQGLRGDRPFGFVQAGVNSPFPWLTGRECPDLLRYKPAYEGEDRWPRLLVTTPEGAVWPVDSDELRKDLEARSGRPVRLHSDYRGTHDVAYVSLITLNTVRAVAEAAGVPADHRRFRMSLVLDSNLPAFAEKEWVGRELTIGGVRLGVTEQDRRCNMITLDPETGQSSPSVLKQAGELNGAFVGVYATVLAAGDIGVGDAVALRPS